ncbi:hypothetical protein P22_3002 [Propionispora sp. 2/2-37]|uniref:cell division protein SepF n=1 Tax=Propionispora sp. 2/2-37 TaxID=1677858 RepID=UPI0006BB6F5C|nr:cell division protein SepF [Propionispora sp. 2/2-37]CUH96890.1 hypothetical protein P22_3002 [Propionispora sp. 2/2-37]
MAYSLIEKLTNFLMPEEEFQQPNKTVNAAVSRAQLTVHSPSELKMLVTAPHSYQDALLAADKLKADYAVVVNLQSVSPEIQQSISDFLNGICYVTGGAVERIADSILLYVPLQVDVCKELYAYSVPTYIKSSDNKVSL